MTARTSPAMSRACIREAVLVAASLGVLLGACGARQQSAAPAAMAPAESPGGAQAEIARLWDEIYVIKETLKLCAESILLTTIVALIIVVIGYLRKWDSSTAYSNAFFLAGCLFIIAGGLSRQAAARDWNTFQLFSAESFRGMGSSEQANFIVEASSPIRRVVLGVLTGIFLILLSAIAPYLF